MTWKKSFLIAAGAISSLFSVSAQFPPIPEGVKELESKIHPGVRISYKEPGICETTEGVKSFAGYVRLPPHALNETHEDNDYPINTFYWFFESRKDAANAPLAIWLNGGPGGSSLIGALSENGPCFVSNDSQTTYLNPWSWNNEANLLFIDQPTQVGYSYDVLTNVTVDMVNSGIVPADFSNGVPETNNTFLVGTSSSQKIENTANSTQHAAVALWHFAQTWFEEFPDYKPNNEQISLFTESYGGHYGPGFWDYFAHQNAKIKKGKIDGHYLQLSTLGVINGCLDAPDMIESEINFAYNNTYGIEAISQADYERSLHEFHKSHGVLDDINTCREMARKTDPHDHGDVEKTNRFCSRAADRALNISDNVYVRAGVGGRFDVTHEATDPFPPPYMMGWLNNHETQRALGVPVNHTWAAPSVSTAFSRTGDLVKGGQKDQIAYLLENGVNVALLHGDRDFACNWIGGENTSLNIPWTHAKDFAKAGYAPLITSPGVETGLIRQYGNFSFTRVFQAGHMVPSYQPEASYRIFMRALTGRDIATGEVDLRDFEKRNKDQYATEGPADTWWRKNEVLPAPKHECYVWDLYGRCEEEEIQWILEGSAVVRDFILVGREGGEVEVGVDEEVENDEVEARFTESGQYPLLGDW